MGYTKDPEMRLVRTNHVVSVYQGDRAQSFLEDMKHLPFEAVLLSWEEDGDELILTFIEEKTSP